MFKLLTVSHSYWLLLLKVTELLYTLIISIINALDHQRAAATSGLTCKLHLFCLD